MQIRTDSEIPIFLQIADGIEGAILSGAFPEGSQIPSITEFSTTYQINPATALKGINLLVDRNILFKKRGVGMFVQVGAIAKLRAKRREDFCKNFVDTLIVEAKQLEISYEELLALIERRYDHE